MSRTPFPGALLAALLTFGTVGAAQAQATRTWVSGVGDDLNPCSRTAPCKTFAGTLPKTAAGGMISVLDPADFGAVEITRSITIDGTSHEGSVQAPGAGGIRIRTVATDRVVLRGLALDGGGTGTGILFDGSGSLVVDRCSIDDFVNGIDIDASGPSTVFLTEVHSVHNSGAGLGIGAVSGDVLVTLVRSHFDDNGVGILANAGAKVSVYDATASRNVTGVWAALGALGGTAEVNLEGLLASGNGTAVQATADSGNAVVRMSKVMATGSVTAPTATTGVGKILSFGNNRLDVLSSIALSSSAPAQTTPVGESATYPLDLAVSGILANPIALTCTGLPAGTHCDFAPLELPADTRAAAVTVTVTTTGPQSTRNDGETGGVDTKLAFLGLPLLFAFRLRKRAGGLWLSLVFFAITGGVACGSDSESTPPTELDPDGGERDAGPGPGPRPDGGSQPDGGPGPDGGSSTDTTPKGTFPFQVRAASGATTGQVELTLTVQ